MCLGPLILVFSERVLPSWNGLESAHAYLGKLFGMHGAYPLRGRVVAWGFGIDWLKETVFVNPTGGDNVASMRGEYNLADPEDALFN